MKVHPMALAASVLGLSSFFTNADTPRFVQRSGDILFDTQPQNTVWDWSGHALERVALSADGNIVTGGRDIHSGAQDDDSFIVKRFNSTSSNWVNVSAVADFRYSNQRRFAPLPDMSSNGNVLVVRSDPTHTGLYIWDDQEDTYKLSFNVTTKQGGWAYNSTAPGWMVPCHAISADGSTFFYVGTDGSGNVYRYKEGSWVHDITWYYRWSFYSNPSVLKMCGISADGNRLFWGRTEGNEPNGFGIFFYQFEEGNNEWVSIISETLNGGDARRLSFKSGSLSADGTKLAVSYVRHKTAGDDTLSHRVFNWNATSRQLEVSPKRFVCTGEDHCNNFKYYGMGAYAWAISANGKRIAWNHPLKNYAKVFEEGETAWNEIFHVGLPSRSSPVAVGINNGVAINCDGTVFAVVIPSYIRIFDDANGVGDGSNCPANIYPPPVTPDIAAINSFASELEFNACNVTIVTPSDVELVCSFSTSEGASAILEIRNGTCAENDGFNEEAQGSVIDNAEVTAKINFASQITTAEKESGSSLEKFCARIDVLVNDGTSLVSIAAKKVDAIVRMSYAKEGTFSVDTIQTAVFTASTADATATRNAAIEAYQCDVYGAPFSDAIAIGNSFSICVYSTDGDVSVEVTDLDLKFNETLLASPIDASVPNFITTESTIGTVIGKGDNIQVITTLATPGIFDISGGNAISATGTAKLTYSRRALQEYSRGLQGAEGVSTSSFNVELGIIKSEVPMIAKEAGVNAAGNNGVMYGLAFIAIGVLSMVM